MEVLLAMFLILVGLGAFGTVVGAPVGALCVIMGIIMRAKSK
jgi:hypothetical protein